jgi:hypothetical protein
LHCTLGRFHYRLIDLKSTVLIAKSRNVEIVLSNEIPDQRFQIDSTVEAHSLRLPPATA